MKKNFYFNFLLVALVCSVLPGNLLAQFAGGSGTTRDPYLIETPEQFNEIRNNLDKSFKLTADLDFANFAEAWVPIGSYSGVRFTGILDGDGHIIKNLHAESLLSGTDGEMGLFGTTGEAHISRLVIKDCVFKGASHVGALASCLWKTTVDQVAVINVEIVGKSFFFHGGLAGQVHDGSTVSNCYTSGKINGKQGSGGITGYMEHGSLITNCYTTATVTGTERATAGICGGVVPDCMIRNCVTICDEITVLDNIRDNDIRIVQEIQDGIPMENNYAYAGTVCNGVTFPDATDGNSKNGISVSMDELKTVAFYAEKPKFAILASDPNNEYYEQIWKIDTRISEYPVFVWQTADGAGISQHKSDQINYVAIGSVEGIRITGLTGGEKIIVYSISGSIAGNLVADGSEAFIPSSGRGIYLISVDGKVCKVVK